MKMMPITDVKLPAASFLDADRLRFYQMLIANGKEKEIKPLHVAEDGRLIDGTHRYYAFKAEGYLFVPVRVNADTE